MQSALEHLLSGNFMPHGHCYLWLPEILWTNVISDAIIAGAYFSIPISILVFVRKRQDVDFKMIPILFSAFIFLCGASHIVAIVTVWNGYYGVQGMVKAATAIVSIATAFWVWRLLPTALLVPSNSQLRDHVADATRKLTRKNRALRRANTDIEHFVSAASHDLKEPLRTLVTYSELLVMDAGESLNDDANRDIEHIIDGAKRMQVLVNDILDLSRSGDAELNVREIDLELLVQDVMDSMEATITTTGACIRVSALPKISGDKVLIRQIFANLISNALKFRREDVAPEIRISAEQSPDGQWTFSVADNGIGIDEEYVTKIFEPFERLHGRDHSEGTGIGLAICKRAIQNHDGTIWVEPSWQGGADFRFTLNHQPS